MPDKIVAEVVSSQEVESGLLVKIETQKMSPLPSRLMVRERARARAIVEAGIADTVSDVFTGGLDIQRLTEVVSHMTIDKDWPTTKHFEVLVKKNNMRS